MFAYLVRVSLVTGMSHKRLRSHFGRSTNRTKHATLSGGQSHRN